MDTEKKMHKTVLCFKNKHFPFKDWFGKIQNMSMKSPPWETKLLFNVKARLSYAFERNGFDSVRKSKNEASISSQF